MLNETRKILALPNLPICATCVRVPVFVGHSISVNVDLQGTFDDEALFSALERQAGIELQRDPKDFPVAADVVGRDEVMVGRVRRDPSTPNGVAMWVVADNLRKGAASNAVQILELIHRDGRWA